MKFQFNGSDVDLHMFLENIGIQDVKDILFDPENIKMFSNVVGFLTPPQFKPFVNIALGLCNNFIDNMSQESSIDLSLWGNEKINQLFKIIFSINMNDPDLHELKDDILNTLVRLGHFNERNINDLLYGYPSNENAEYVDDLIIKLVIPQLVSQILLSTARLNHMPKSLYFSKALEEHKHVFEINDNPTFLPSIIEVGQTELDDAIPMSFSIYLKNMNENRRNRILKEIDNKASEIFGDYHHFPNVFLKELQVYFKKEVK